MKTNIQEGPAENVKLLVIQNQVAKRFGFKSWVNLIGNYDFSSMSSIDSLIREVSESYAGEMNAERDSGWVRQILKRKSEGVDCTEEESAELKGWLKQYPGVSNLKNLISCHFPIEFAEYLAEEPFYLQVRADLIDRDFELEMPTREGESLPAVDDLGNVIKYESIIQVEDEPEDGFNLRIKGPDERVWNVMSIDFEDYKETANAR